MQFGRAEAACGGEGMKASCCHSFERMGMGSEDADVVGAECGSETAEPDKEHARNQRRSLGKEERCSRVRRILSRFMSEG